MNTITKLLLINLTITLLCANICRPQTYLQEVYSTSLTASTKTTNNFVLNKSRDSSTYAYNLPRAFPKNPQVAFALCGFNAFQKVNFTIFVSITNTTSTLTNILINTSWKNTDWTSISFNILLNSRIDIQVGSYSFGRQSNSNSIAIPFKKNLLNTSNYVARAFISGFDISGTGVNSLNILGGTINNTHFPINVTSSKTIQLLQISYLLFNPKMLGFSAYGGSINKISLSTLYQQSVFRNVASFENFIYGITGFSINSSTLLIDSKIDQRFLLTINPGNGVNSLGLTYIIFGNGPKSACSSCNNTIVNSSQACLSTCPENTALYTFPDGGKACIQCPKQANLILNLNKTDCICINGYTLSNGICVIANVFNISTKITNPPTPLTTSNLTVSISTNSNDLDPQPYVPHKCSDSNSYWDGSRCSCLPKYYLMHQICLPCSPITFWNGQTCVSISYGNQEKKKENNKSQPIRVTCNGTNQFVRADNRCGCLKGFYMNNGICTVGIQCPDNSIRISATSCKCNSGYLNNSGFCTKCKPWFYYNQNNQNCQTACPSNSIYNQILQNCVCLAGYYQSSQYSCLPCPQGSNWIAGKCITCPIYSSFINGKCVCNIGYSLKNGFCQLTNSGSGSGSGSGSIPVNLPPGSFIINGVIATCPLNTIYDINLKKCFCKPGYLVGSNGICQASCINGIILNGVCNLCPIYSNPFGGSCVCNSGYTKINGICTISCKAPYFLYQGKCVSCPISSTWNSNTFSCNCNPGFIKNTYGICVNQCPVGSALINNVCKCISGFFSIANSNSPPCSACSAGCLSCKSLSSCASCSIGYSLIQGVCQPAVVKCASNQFLQNNICVNCNNNCQKCNSVKYCLQCKPGYILNSAKNCQLPITIPTSNQFKIDINTNFVIQVVYIKSTTNYKILSVKSDNKMIKCIGAGIKIFCQRNGYQGIVTLTITTNTNNTTILTVPAAITTTLIKPAQKTSTPPNTPGRRTPPIRPV